MAYVLLGCRLLLGLVFLAAAAGKVRGRRQYAGFVSATGRLLPRRLAGRVPAGRLAGAVLAAELGVVLLLAVPATAGWGFALAAALAGSFAAAIAAALRRGDRAPCHCFGASARPLGGGQLVRNLLLVAGAGTGLAAVAAGAGTAPVEPAGVVAALVVAGVLAALVVTADDLAALFRPATLRVPTRT